MLRDSVWIQRNDSLKLGYQADWEAQMGSEFWKSLAVVDIPWVILPTPLGSHHACAYFMENSSCGCLYSTSSNNYLSYLGLSFLTDSSEPSSAHNIEQEVFQEVPLQKWVVLIEWPICTCCWGSLSPQPDRDHQSCPLSPVPTSDCRHGQGSGTHPNLFSH